MVLSYFCLQIDWAENIRKSWDFSEDGAHARLEAFLHDGEASLCLLNVNCVAVLLGKLLNGCVCLLLLFLGVYRYEKESGRADAPNTSCLSPYLHFGQLSPRWLLWDAKGARCRPPKFQRKLAWRDLAYWQLTLFPDLPWESLRPPYKVKIHCYISTLSMYIILCINYKELLIFCYLQALRWSTDCRHLKAWQKGKTGYPLVDAAMRQLWLTGWMNNYMRHVVASFLIAYLHLPWQEGYRWFQVRILQIQKCFLMLESWPTNLGFKVW